MNWNRNDKTKNKKKTKFQNEIEPLGKRKSKSRPSYAYI